MPVFIFSFFLEFHLAIKFPNEKFGNCHCNCSNTQCIAFYRRTLQTQHCKNCSRDCTGSIPSKRIYMVFWSVATHCVINFFNFFISLIIINLFRMKKKIYIYIHISIFYYLFVAYSIESIRNLKCLLAFILVFRSKTR